VRQVVRTAGQVVYVFAPDDTAQRENAGPGVIRAYRAGGRGVPTGFSEVDPAHRPSSSGTNVLYAPDVRLDRHGVAHLVYVDQASDRLYYQTFSTRTNRWGPRRVLGGGAVANPGFYSTPTRVFRNCSTPPAGWTAPPRCAGTPQRDHDPALIDAVHHAEDVRGDGSYLPQLFYQAVRP
jgi:hypothetical protein